MKGGRVAEIPEDVSAILKPESVPDFLWSQLVDQYNRSQLFAIRYVVELQREDMRQDTQISLIQGPPGTGKTKTILGLVAVLLQRQRNSSKSGPESQVSVWSPDFSTGAGSRKQRILICAPSNAAIDELLSRLAKGVLNSRAGEGPRYFNLVRLGSVSEASSTELAEYTLDSKTTMVVEKSQLYQDFIALEEEISGLVQAINASEYQSPASSTKSSDRWPSRHELKVKLRKNIQDKMRMKAALDRMVVNVRNSILDAADVVMGTLSAAGSRQLMDYIESTHFETEKSREEISMASGNIAQTFDQSLVANRHARRFDTVIVDESAQATEPSTLIPLRFGCRKLVLVGDPRQLPATVLDKRAAAAGLGVSLFERLERSDHEVVMLQVRYFIYYIHPFVSSN
jgi:senataxin